MPHISPTSPGPAPTSAQGHPGHLLAPSAGKPVLPLCVYTGNRGPPPLHIAFSAWSLPSVSPHNDFFCYINLTHCGGPRRWDPALLNCVKGKAPRSLSSGPGDAAGWVSHWGGCGKGMRAPGGRGSAGRGGLRASLGGYEEGLGVTLKHRFQGCRPAGVPHPIEVPVVVAHPRAHRVARSPASSGGAVGIRRVKCSVCLG